MVRFDPITAGQTGPWHKRSLSFAFEDFNIGENAPTQSQAAQAIRKAFTTWAQTGLRLSFTETSLNEDPDIRVGWRDSDDPDSDLSGGFVAHADLPPRFSVVNSHLALEQRRPLPLHFDRTHNWAIGAAENAYDIESIALHEIGHCLGIVHLPQEEAVMFDSVLPNLLKRQLSNHDLAFLQRLYPPEDMS